MKIEVKGNSGCSINIVEEDNNLYVYIQKKIRKQKDEIFADKFAVQFLNKYRIEIERMLIN